MVYFFALWAGFGLGILFCEFFFRSRERDLLDRISWRNPEDYFFMKWQREEAAKVKPKFKLLDFSALTKKEKPQVIKLDPQKKAEEIKRAIENQVSAKDEQAKNYKEYLDHREEMAKAGISAP